MVFGSIFGKIGIKLGLKTLGKTAAKTTVKTASSTIFKSVSKISFSGISKVALVGVSGAVIFDIFNSSGNAVNKHILNPIEDFLKIDIPDQLGTILPIVFVSIVIFLAVRVVRRRL